MSYFEGYQQTLFFYPDALTAPGVTEVYDVYVINYLSTRNYTLSVTVSSINTSVVVRLDGSVDGVNFGPMISNTITENGTYIYNTTGNPVKQVRANFLQETGGTTAKVTFSISAN
jgi:hypothetical protein